MELQGKRATVMGLGHFGGGVAAARWLASQGAIVTVTDLAGEETLREAIQTLAGEPIAAWRLGGHREEDFTRTDLVVVNPAVRPGSPYLELARAAGVELTSEIELFLNRCRGRIVGVTGSNGKSTTAAMTAACLRAAGRRCWLGGNVGRSLLDELPAISSDNWVVLELSSFQLCHLTERARMPEVAIVTNCTPNHLNWHPDFAHYAAAKQRLLGGLPPGGLAVLNPMAPELGAWRECLPVGWVSDPTSCVGWVSDPTCLADRVSDPISSGRRDDEEDGRVGDPTYEGAVVPDDWIPPLGVPGEHNRQNARLAATAALGVGCDPEPVRQGLADFRGLPQRLEWFAVVGGRRFYNDSTATTPESTIAALSALDGPLWLLAGGADKGVDYNQLAAAIAARVRGVALFGAVGARLEAAVAACRPALPRTVVSRLDEALAWCWERSRPGQTILLSPACASLDQFRHFRDRGEQFVEMVKRLVE